jgi:predicted nucleotidyltransferase
MDLLPDFRDLLSALAASNAEYVVVGGWAVAFHTEPRFTKDLDLLIGTEPANLQRVVDAARTFGAPRSILDQLATLGDEEFLILGTPPARVDLLRTIPGVDFRVAMSRAKRVDWDGVTVNILSREDLIASKRAAGRERDLRDLRRLESG